MYLKLQKSFADAVAPGPQTGQPVASSLGGAALGEMGQGIFLVEDGPTEDADGQAAGGLRRLQAG